MEYAEQDRAAADATGAFPVVGRHGTSGVRYADSGSLPDEGLPDDGARLAGGARPASDSGRREGRPLMEISHVMSGGYPRADTTDSGFPEWGTADHGLARDGAPPRAGTADGGVRGPDESPGPFPRAERYPDTDTGSYPAGDWYAGYERYAGERHKRAGQPDEDSFKRVYARPADPREPRPPAAGYPMADDPGQASLAGRLTRLRPDRWIIAGGSLAAAVAVVVAFVMAGGSAATSGTRTGQTGTMHAAQPACVSPAPGR